MRWTKRLKWLRISRIVIPIAFAISIVFAGFTVFAHEAEYFVLRVSNDSDVNLALTMKRDLTEQTSRLLVPVEGTYEDATYTPDKAHLYNSNRYSTNIPDDIAKQDGMHSIFEYKGGIAFFSFSFWLVNNSSRAVDVDMHFNIDSVTSGTNNTAVHIDDAVRVMLIEGEPLLSDKTYTIYKKPEKTEENENYLNGNIKYGTDRIVSFASDICIADRSGELGYKNLGESETLRFTVVIWLEGFDKECIDEILNESMKMNITFNGY